VAPVHRHHPECVIIIISSSSSSSRSKNMLLSVCHDACMLQGPELVHLHYVEEHNFVLRVVRALKLALCGVFHDLVDSRLCIDCQGGCRDNNRGAFERQALAPAVFDQPEPSPQDTCASRCMPWLFCMHVLSASSCAACLANSLLTLLLPKRMCATRVLAPSKQQVGMQKNAQPSCLRL